MLKPLLLIAFITTAVACTRHTDNTGVKNNTNSSADTSQVAKLITKGHTMQYDNKDVLPRLAAQLDSVSTIQNNKEGLIYASVFRAYAFWFSADYTNGMKTAVKALSDADKWKINKPVPEIYSIMANMHKENGNYKDAFEDCKKGLAEAKLNKDTAFIISLLGLNAMFTHGYYRKNGRADDDHVSLPMQLEALQLAEAKPKYESARIRFYNNIAQTYKEQHAYRNALIYANKAIILANKYHQVRSLTYSYNWMGEAYYYMGEHEKGIAYLDSAIALSRQISMPYREMEINEAMHWCYMATKDFEPAIASLKRFEKIRDSLQIAKNEKQISELQLQYESVKKDRQIASLDSSNNLNRRKVNIVGIGLIFFVLLLLIILYQYKVIHQNNKLTKKNNELLNDALLKIAHIQSHQIRKPLASILGLMNIIKASNYHADRELLEKMDQVAHELDQRIRDVIKETEIVED